MWGKCSALGAGAGEPATALSGVKGLTYAGGFAAAGAAGAIGEAALAATSGDAALAIAFAPPIASRGGPTVGIDEKLIVFRVVMRLLSWLCRLSWPLDSSAI